MLSFLNRYAKNFKYSQNGEEALLLEVFTRIGTDGGYCIEVGGHDGHFCANTALLLENGWSGLFVEADYGLYLKSKANWASCPNVRHQCCQVDERNINAFVDERCDLLSLDTDGADYKIFCGMNARPKIVIVEIDSSLPPFGSSFNKDGAANYWAMTEAALERGYFVLCHCGNLILVHQHYGHLFPEIDKHPLLDYEHFFNDAWMERC